MELIEWILKDENLKAAIKSEKEVSPEFQQCH